MSEWVEGEIKARENLGKELAKKYPELKGLPFEEFILKIPPDTNFITASVMFEEVNR